MFLDIEDISYDFFNVKNGIIIVDNYSIIIHTNNPAV